MCFNTPSTCTGWELDYFWSEVIDSRAWQMKWSFPQIFRSNITAVFSVFFSNNWYSLICYTYHLETVFPAFSCVTMFLELEENMYQSLKYCIFLMHFVLFVYCVNFFLLKHRFQHLELKYGPLLWYLLLMAISSSLKFTISSLSVFLYLTFTSLFFCCTVQCIP